MIRKKRKRKRKGLREYRREEEKRRNIEKGYIKEGGMRRREAKRV